MFLHTSQVLTIAIFVTGKWNILPTCCQVPHTSHLKGNFWYYHHSPITAPLRSRKFANNKNGMRISSFKATTPASTTQSSFVEEKSRKKQGPERNSRLITYTNQEQQKAMSQNILSIQNDFKKDSTEAPPSSKTENQLSFSTSTEKMNTKIEIDQGTPDKVINANSFQIIRPLSEELTTDDFIVVNSFPRVKNVAYSTERPRPVYIHSSSLTKTNSLQTKPTTVTPLEKPTSVSSFSDVFPDILNNALSVSTQNVSTTAATTTQEPTSKPSSIEQSNMAQRFLEKARTEKLVSGTDYISSTKISFLIVLFHAMQYSS